VKNSYFKYVLALATIVIWVAIGYRIVKGMGHENVATAPAKSAFKNDMKMASDTFTVFADYPDPFVPEEERDSADTPPKTAVPPTPPPQINSSSSSQKESISNIIQFNGLIANPQKKYSIGLITIRGKEYIVKVGQKIDDIVIRKLSKNKLTILYKHELYRLEK
jgi:hypothetical protein